MAYSSFDELTDAEQHEVSKIRGVVNFRRCRYIAKAGEVTVETPEGVNVKVKMPSKAKAAAKAKPAKLTRTLSARDAIKFIDTCKDLQLLLEVTDGEERVTVVRAANDAIIRLKG